MTDPLPPDTYVNKLSKFAYSWCLRVRERLLHVYNREELVAELESTFLSHESEFKVTLKEIYPLILKYEKFMKNTINTSSEDATKTSTPSKWREPVGLFMLAFDIFNNRQHWFGPK